MPPSAAETSPKCRQVPPFAAIGGQTAALGGTRRQLKLAAIVLDCREKIGGKGAIAPPIPNRASSWCLFIFGDLITPLIGRFNTGGPRYQTTRCFVTGKWRFFADRVASMVSDLVRGHAAHS